MPQIRDELWGVFRDDHSEQMIEIQLFMRLHPMTASVSFGVPKNMN